MSKHAAEYSQQSAYKDRLADLIYQNYPMTLRRATFLGSSRLLTMPQAHRVRARQEN